MNRMKALKQLGLGAGFLHEGFQGAVTYPPLAEGGTTITDFTDTGSGQVYKVHTFTANGSFNINKKPLTVDYVIAGGGGGSSGGGGSRTAGKGAMSSFYNISVRKQNYIVTIGHAGTSNGGGSSSFNDATLGGGGLSANGAGSNVASYLDTNAFIASKIYKPSGATTDYLNVVVSSAQAGFVIIRYKTWQGYAEFISSLIEYVAVYYTCLKYWTPLLPTDANLISKTNMYNTYINSTTDFLPGFDNIGPNNTVYVNANSDLVNNIVKIVQNTINNLNLTKPRIESAVPGITFNASLTPMFTGTIPTLTDANYNTNLTNYTGYFETMFTPLKTAITSMTATYSTTRTSLTSAGLTIPSVLDLDTTTDTTNVAATKLPFISKPGIWQSIVPVLTSATQTISGNSDSSKNGLYKVTSSSQLDANANADFRAFDDTGAGWASNAVTVAATFDAWLQIQLPSSKPIWGYSFTSTDPAYGPETFQFQGSNDGTTWTTLDIQYKFSGATYDTKFPIPSTSFSYYRLQISARQHKSVPQLVVIIHSLILYEYTGTIAPTKQDQLLKIYDRYKKANDGLQAILQSAKFKTTYEAARKYILDSELLATTITTRDAIYSGTGTYTVADILAARRDVLKTLITRYYQLKPTASTAVSDVPTGAPSATVPTEDDVSTANEAELNAAESKFLTRTAPVPLWPALMADIRTFVTGYINGTYKTNRDLAFSPKPAVDGGNFVTEATMTRDVSYVSTPAGNMDVVGNNVRYFISATDATGLSGYSTKKIGKDPIFIPPNSITAYSPVANGYTFLSGAETITLRASSTTTPNPRLLPPYDLRDLIGNVGRSGWVGADTILFNFTVKNKVKMFGISMPSSFATNVVFTIYGKIAINSMSDTLSIGNSELTDNDNGNNYYFYPVTNVTNYIEYQLKADGSTSQQILNQFMLFSSTEKITLYNIPSEYSFVATIFNKYKTLVDALAFQNEYNSLRRYLPNPTAANPAPTNILLLTRALVTSFENAYNTWTARGVPTDTAYAIPDNIDANKTAETGLDAIRGDYKTRWEKLMPAIQTFTKTRIQRVIDLKTWHNTPSATTLTDKKFGTSAPILTKGLGASPPLP